MTTLAQISETQAQKATTANENFDAVSWAGMFGRRAVGISGLTWAYFGGMLYAAGVATPIADGTVALTNTATNYVEVTNAGVVSANTSGFTTGRIPLYTVTCAGGVITAYTDYRAKNSFGDLSLNGALTVTSSSASSLAVGPNGATNPVLKVDSSTGSQAAGLSLTGAVAAGTVALAVISSGSNANLSINAKGSGTIGIGSVSTGAVTITPATTLSGALTYGGVTLSNAVTGTGNMVLSASPTLSGTVGGSLTFSGTHTLSAALTYGGVTLSNAVTGTGNMVLSAGPTLTGTLSAATITASGAITSTLSGVGLASISNASFDPSSSDAAALQVGTSFGGGIILKDGTGRAGMWTKSTGAQFHLRAGGTSSGFGTDVGHLVITSSSISTAGAVASGSHTLASITSVGGEMSANGQLWAVVNGDVCGWFNRRSSDGTVINLYAQDVNQGSISISGATVSYNAFHGSHWAQLADGSRAEILKGTVIESIDDLCEWPADKIANDRLPKVKVSDTAGSPAVYGVFLAWDDDEFRLEDVAQTGEVEIDGELYPYTVTVKRPREGVNDLYVSALGAGWVRIDATQKVRRGDLLESAGNGCARVQADDVVRSSTIGKVSAAVAVTKYPDGSFLMPATLMCG
jgi:hypothetical protein